MATSEPTTVLRTSQHLIVETTSTESLAGAVIPSIKSQGVTIASVGHLQITRYVYTLVEAQEIHFQGRRLEAMPGIREAVVELIKPGRQIVSRPTGRYSVLHAYTGKKNIVQAQLLRKTFQPIPLGYIDLIGEDPAPRIRLYGRSNVPFVTRGEASPIAAAFYDAAAGRLQIVENPDPKTLLARLAAHAPRSAVPVS